MPELEHRRQVLKKLRQQFEPIDLKQIARDWEENHPAANLPAVEAVRKRAKAGGNAGVMEEFSAFAGMPSVYRCSRALLRCSAMLCAHRHDVTQGAGVHARD